MRLEQPFWADKVVRADSGQDEDQFLGVCGNSDGVIVQVHLNVVGRDADGGDQDLVVVGVLSKTGKRTVDGGQRRRAHQQHGNQQGRQAHHRRQIDGWNRWGSAHSDGHAHATGGAFETLRSMKRGSVHS